MMLFKSKNYPLGMIQILWLEGKLFDKRRFGFWKHPKTLLGVFAEWTLRIGLFQIQKWISEKEK